MAYPQGINFRQTVAYVTDGTNQDCEPDTGGDLDIAHSYSASAHEHAVRVWGSENDYVQAHGEFGTEITSVSGDRSMVSVTTDPATQSWDVTLSNGATTYAINDLGWLSDVPNIGGFSGKRSRHASSSSGMSRGWP